MTIKKIVKLPQEDTGMQTNIVRFHNSMIDSKKTDKKRFFRREAIAIVNGSTGDKVIRYAMGNPGLPGLTKDAISVDYDAVDDLNTRYGDQEVEIYVRRAKLFEIIAWFWNHKDLNVQLSMRLSLLGLVFGLAGLASGIS